MTYQSNTDSCSCDSVFDSNGCFNIKILPGDEFFKEEKCILFKRSIDQNANYKWNLPYREQGSTKSAFLDLTNVYGANEKKLHKLRKYSKGLLLSSFVNDKMIVEC